MPLFDVEKLMAGNIAQLRLEREFFSSLTSHRGEIGRLNETHLVRTLRRYLPPKFGIGTGFVVSGGKAISQSPQCDIIIYDAFNNAPFYSSEAWQIFPIEMVYGIIEVKTYLNKTQLRDAFNKCVYIRSMCQTAEGEPNLRYLRPLPPAGKEGAPALPYSSAHPPIFMIFGYGGPARDKLAKMFHAVTLEEDAAHISAACVLDDASGLFMQHLIYREPQERASEVSSNGLWRFLTHMPIFLNSAMPWVKKQNSDDFFSREAFDLVDLDHYSQALLEG